jgi:hypothetical protein
MSSNDRNSPPLHSPDPRRRASITSQTFHDLFGRSNSMASLPTVGQQSSGPITTAAANAQRRRLSLTTIGLGASPGQTSPFLQTPRTRTESISSANSGSVDESPFEDDFGPSSSSNPATPFARRLSFGARAMRDVRQGNGGVGNPNGRPPIHKASSPPTGRGRGEGYNFAENLRSRAERGSISGPSGMLSPSPPTHQRAKSVTIMEPPAREMPKPKVPDAMQERILKGDFYMD